MIRFNRIAAAAFAAGALGLAAPAFAQDAYPRVVGTGENASLEYGPGPARNIVGGGAVEARDAAGGGAEVRHFDESYVQQGRQNTRSVTIGNGENQRTVWLPNDAPVNAASLRAAALQG